ncbi:MAG: hypothetical protein M3T56_10350 [Chloroflexota bacterium]|nr:hypothetical protein [Chloroflexota bacterium]
MTIARATPRPELEGDPEDRLWQLLADILESEEPGTGPALRILKGGKAGKEKPVDRK